MKIFGGQTIRENKGKRNDIKKNKILSERNEEKGDDICRPGQDKRFEENVKGSGEQKERREREEVKRVR